MPCPASLIPFFREHFSNTPLKQEFSPQALLLGNLTHDTSNAFTQDYLVHSFKTNSYLGLCL